MRSEVGGDFRLVVNHCVLKRGFAILREGERGGIGRRGGREGREGEKRGGKREKERERGREKRREKGPAPKVQLRSEALHTAVKIFFGGCAPRPGLEVEGEGASQHKARKMRRRNRQR